MDTETRVYVSALLDSLHKKQVVLQRLLDLTEKQQKVLLQKNPDMDQFEALINEKDVHISSLNELDRGFQSLFEKIGSTLQQQKKQYSNQIQQMQECIRKITELGVRIEGLEHQNRDVFQKYLMQERQEIRAGRVSTRTAASYYQNMPNQHHAWQTYFMDQKK